MFNEVAEEAKTVNYFIFSHVVELLQNSSEIGLGTRFDSRGCEVLKDFHKLTGQLHHLRSHCCHFCKIFFDSLDVLFIKLIVFLRLAQYYLGG